MAMRKPREGSFLRIHLGTCGDGFARVLPNSQIAVDAHRAAPEVETLPAMVYGSKVLWTLTVMKSALTSGRWSVVDCQPLDAALAMPVHYFIRDRFTGAYSVYRSSDGYTRPSSLDECKTVEAVAAWGAEQIEDRLRDHFCGQPNAWALQLKPVA